MINFIKKVFKKKETKLNKYGNLSWWYIFDECDKVAHGIAIQHIWECMTASATIRYFMPMKASISLTSNTSNNSPQIGYNISNQTNNTIDLELFYHDEDSWYKDYFKAYFTFVKIKLWN